MIARGLFGVWGARVLFTALLGCGGPNIAVPSHPQPEFASAERVATPPPPAQIENLDGTPPAPGCLWADGQWEWAAQRWEWRPGGWIRPPEDCKYSAPTASGVPTNGPGVLYYRPGRWYSLAARRVCPEPKRCPSTTPSNLPAGAAPPDS